MPEHKQWTIAPPPDSAASAKIAKELSLSLPTARLLVMRGVKTAQEAKRFLSMQDELFHDPFLLRDMEKATVRIARAIARKEPITVYGDYDVDGVTATTLLYLYLRKNGAVVNYYIPRRFGEGYGMNEGALRRLASEGTRLLITVDNGITANDECELLDDLGVDVIITDHHTCRTTLPRAVAVINPHRDDNEYPFTELAGVGVAFKLICALEQKRCEAQGLPLLPTMQALYDEYIDLAAIGTIADVMPLQDENRLMVRYGLSRIERAPRVGLEALLRACSADPKGRTQKRRVNASFIGFTVAPRINAAGRMEHAQSGVELLLQETQAQAQACAEKLCALNRARQAEENRIAEEANALLQAHPEYLNAPVIVLAKEKWHQGVIGIVASRICECYQKPCILIALENGVGKGSGRSIKGLNLAHALAGCEQYLIQYGGHELAAGLSLSQDQIAPFRRAIGAYADLHFKPDQAVLSLPIDLELTANEITLAQAKELDLLEPYGNANAQPIFALRNASISQMQSIGAGRHTKLTLLCEDRSFTALYFGAPQESLDFEVGEVVDVAFQLDINEFQGNVSVQLLLKDIAHPKSAQKEIAQAIIDYYALHTSACARAKALVPTYEQFGALYRHLRRLSTGQEGFTVSVYALERAMQKTLSWAQIRFVLDVFAQLHFLTLDVVCEDPAYFTYRIRLLPTKEKVQLEQSALYCAASGRLEQ
jgi:single-stranded-DNA-specific exonuclease